MLVSHRYKFIYTKTIKTGGTSVESYFERFCMPVNEWTLSHARDEHVSEAGIVGFRGSNPPQVLEYWNHMPAALIRDKVGKEVWERYFKFCVIRNPYDKAVSAFYFFKRANKGSVELVDLDQEQAEFESWLLRFPLPNDRDKYIIDGKFCLNTVIRYETLATDLERVCGQLGIPWDPSLLPNFKAGMRPKNARTDSLYTDKSRKVVESAYAFELDYFKYSFPAEHLQSE
jgi:hypothetical protein